MKEKTTIGRRDKCDFPELELEDIDIKIDTGAYTSAIHCREIVRRSVDGRDVLEFTLLDPTHPQYGNKKFTTDQFTEKKVKSSFGTSERRFVIKTVIVIFGKKYRISLSLSERGEMRFPILIGRKFLVGKFIVDPARYDLSHQQKISTT